MKLIVLLMSVISMNIQVAYSAECNGNALVDQVLQAQGFQPTTALAFFDKIKSAKQFINATSIEAGNKHSYLYDVIMGSGPTRTVKKTQNYGYALQAEIINGSVSKQLVCSYRDLYWPDIFGNFDPQYRNKISWDFFVGDLIDRENAEIVPGHVVSTSIETKGNLDPGHEKEFVLLTNPKVISLEQKRAILWDWDQRIQRPEYEYESQDGCEISRKYYFSGNTVAEKIEHKCKLSGDNKGIEADSTLFMTYVLL